MMPRCILYFGWLLLAMGVLALDVAPSMAQDWAANEFGARQLEEPVEKGHKALQRMPQANWYDADEDGLRSIPVPGETQMPGTRPGQARKTTTPAANRNWNLPSWGDLSIGQILMYLLLIVVLAVLAYLIFRAIRAGGPASVRSGSVAEQHDTSRQVDRVEHLPFEVKKKDANLLDEARRCYEAGNFNEAIVYLFSFQLLELDKGHIIRLTKGKTNGQYLRETAGNRPLRQILQQTMNAFEDVFFGHRTLSRERFERCWNQISQFDQLVQGGQA